MNKILVSLFLFCCHTSVIAQSKGFMGKTNEVSIDLVPLVLGGFYGLHYKKVLSKRLSVNVSYSLVKKEGDYYQNTKFLFFPDKSEGSNGTYDLSGYNFGAYLLYSLPYAGMEMPFGNYLGYGFDVLHVDNSIFIKSSTNSLSGQPVVQDTLEYTNTQCRFSFVFGRDSYISSNIIIDMSLQWGLAFSSLNDEEEDPNSSFYHDNKSLLLPRRGELFGGVKFNFFIYPQFKIGYIF